MAHTPRLGICERRSDFSTATGRRIEPKSIVPSNMLVAAQPHMARAGEQLLRRILVSAVGWCKHFRTEFESFAPESVSNHNTAVVWPLMAHPWLPYGLQSPTRFVRQHSKRLAHSPRAHRTLHDIRRLMAHQCAHLGEPAQLQPQVRSTAPMFGGGTDRYTATSRHMRRLYAVPLS